MTTLVIGGEDDDHAVFMVQHLNESGHDCEMLDSRWFPSRLGLSHEPVRDEWHIRLPSGRELPPGSVRSIYWRCYNGIETPDLADPEQAFVAMNDARSLFESFLMRYPTRWVNDWDGFRLHQTKPAALAMVAALGIEVPRTYSGNDPEGVKAFMAREQTAIFKPVQGGAHTRHVTARHMRDENLRNLKYAPVTLQEEIVGTNVRAFVAGERVIGVEVKAGTLDFRDTDDPVILPHSFSDEMEAKCRLIARTLSLRWAGIDFRLTDQGRYAYLEANPSPMFLGFQARSGLPLAEALAELLTGE